MAFEALDLPITEVSLEEKRAIPEFIAEEKRAERRLLHPEVQRPIRPMYAFVRSRTPDLSPREVSPDIKLWEELRYLATGELNYPLWAGDVAIEGAEHQLVIHSAHGTEGSNSYAHRVLRCNCCLPDYRDISDIDGEYQPCLGKEMVIDGRSMVFKKILGVEGVDRQSLLKATSFLIELIKKRPEKWAPTDRSDRLLVGKLAKVFEVPGESMMRTVKELEENKVIQLRGEQYPSISLVA